jgi:methylated-DNA-[protein]-cysteine S-methyltransferase
MTLYSFDSPIGRLSVAGDHEAITHLYFATDKPHPALTLGSTPLLVAAAEQVTEYLEGRRTDFDLPLRPAGTPFMQAVWDRLRAIPYGETRSYKQLAAALGNPKAARAVGMANNRNPIPLIIPCHRVVGSGGKLVGFRGGWDIKRRLLELEGAAL